ncbi:unnamed protein product [Closterium sp. NIES-65]|nr:unnamed protein product [Closterium sp. NIES-65]CAI5987883.1 unnamed protein product [Closterium sp. NIES-65]
MVRVIARWRFHITAIINYNSARESVGTILRALILTVISASIGTVHTALALPPRELDHSIVKPHYVHAVPVLHGEAAFSFVEFVDEQGETLHGRVHLLLSVASACAAEDEEDRAVAFFRRWIPQNVNECTGCMIMHPAVFDNGYHVVPIDAIQKTVHMVQSFEHPTYWFLNKWAQGCREEPR